MIFALKLAHKLVALCSWQSNNPNIILYKSPCFYIFAKFFAEYIIQLKNIKL